MSAYIERRFPGVAVPIVDINCRCFTSQFAAFATHPRRWGYCLLFMGRLWQGRHNSRTPCETCVPGFPPSPWEAVRKSHYSPYRSMRTGRCSGLQGLKRRSLGQLVHLIPLSQTVVLAARPMPLLYGFRTRNTVCSVFKVPREARSPRLSLSVQKRLFFQSGMVSKKIVHRLFTIVFSALLRQAYMAWGDTPSISAIFSTLRPRM